MDTLPALSSLADLPDYCELHPSAAQQEAFERVRAASLCGEAGAADGLLLGCVVRLDRGFPAVVTRDGLVRAEFSARLSKGGNARVAVGDWVCLRAPEAHEMLLIEEILPRESDVARWRGGARGERQTLAANVDVVIAVAALGGATFSAARVARAAVVARDCGSEVAVVLTKADRAGAEGILRATRELRALLGEALRLVVTAARGEDETGELARVAREAGALWGCPGVRSLVPAGTLAIVLGESGAGKSTLLNALVGHEVLETGTVRETDDAGRHTTVARRMVALPDAGVIVDEPGLRSLPLVGHERGLALVFPEIAEAARGCRFRDCTHTHEPGCAVRAALAEGSFRPGALDVYLALAGEMRASAGTLDPDVVL